MSLEIRRDTITPHAEKLIRGLRAETFMEAAAKAVQVKISEHLRALQARGNVKGWPSRRFFAGGPDSVERRVGITQIESDRAVISIADPRFAHRISGGTVTAKRAQALAIPLTAQAYAAGGKGSLREAFPGLKLIKTRENALLATVAKRGEITPHFVLKKSVTHAPHPEEAPDVEDLQAAARRAFLRALEILKKP